MEKLIAGFLAMLVVLSFSGAAQAQVTSTSLRETFLNQDPDPAEPGEYVELRWKVEKLGNGRINDVEYVLDVEYPFFFDQSDTPSRVLGNLEGFSDEEEFFTLFWKVRVDGDAIEDTYQVRLKSRANFADSFVSREYDVRVGDKERAEFILGQITTSPTKLASDLDEAQIDIEIANIGDGDAENTVVEMELPEGFSPSFSFSEREALGTIAQGSSKTASFFIDIGKDVAGGIHEASLRISYKDSSDDDVEVKTAIIDLDLPLKDKPMFEITETRTIPEPVLPGQTVELRLRIENTGGEEADSVTVRAFKESSQPFEFDEKSDFIGKLGPGETGEAVLSMTVDQGAVEKNYILDLEIRAVDGDEVLVQDKTIDLRVGGQTGEGMTGAVIEGITALSLAAFVVVAVLVGLGAFLYGRRSVNSRIPGTRG